MINSQDKYIKDIKRKNLIILLIQIGILIIFLFTWEVLSKRKIINSFIFSSPSKIFKTIVDLIRNGTLFSNLFITLQELLLAFLIGFFLSLILSIVFFSFPITYKIAEPYIIAINSLPKVALGPLIIIWCGANIKSVIVMGLLINLIVSLITIYTGMSNIDKSYLLLFKSLGASKIDTLRYLVLPISISSIISSIKLNLSMSFIGIIMGEFLSSKGGIGYLIIYGTQVFNLDLVLSGIIILVILSFIIYKPISILEEKMLYRYR